MQLLLISGLSGSGKSVALRILEDCGYYCVDNLPADMLSALVENLHHSSKNVAVSIDVRSGSTVRELPHHIDQLKLLGIDVHLIFLTAKTDTLVMRYSETRRRHPLSDEKLTLPECLEQERELLSDVSNMGHHIDTSELSVGTLRAWITDFIHVDRAHLTILFQSFGFKKGIPLDSDLMFDVRCLTNPYYDPALRPLTGRDSAVIEFLERAPSVSDMYDDIRIFVETWLPCYIADNRSYLTIAIGCTGGHHRSVYLAEKLAGYFRPKHQVLLRHRELIAL